MKKNKSMPVALGIASVWFGAHCGPGVASGNQIATFYSKFSIYGIFTSIIAMGILGLCIYYSIEYARLTESYDFKTFANKFFYPYEKFFASFFEITYVATVFMVLGSCIATGAQALNQQFGWSIFVGIGLLVLITILLTIFGANLVRSASTAMTLIILIAIGIIIVSGLTSSNASFADHWNQVSSLPETLPKFKDVSILPAIWSAVLYAGFQSAGNMANAVSVVKGLESRRDSVKATVIGIIINTGLIMGVTLLLFAFPNVLGEFFNPERVSKSFIPNLEVAGEIGNPLLIYLYITVLILAIITTLVGFAYAVIARYGKFVPMKEGSKRDLVTVVILLVIAAVVSLVGLDAIVRVGFKYLAYSCIILVIIPTIFIGHRKITNFRKE